MLEIIKILSDQDGQDQLFQLLVSEGVAEDAAARLVAEAILDVEDDEFLSALGQVLNGGDLPCSSL